jgi:hypothetical protein
MPSLKLKHEPLPQSSSYKVAKRQERRLRRRIENALSAGNHRRAKGLTRLYLSSFEAKRVAVRRANKKMHSDCRIPRNKECELAAKLDPWRGTDEPARVRPKFKAKGGFRPIFNFGIENRALQKLVGNALKPWSRHQISPVQFAVRGGRHKACQAVLKGLDQGHVWVTQLDIRSCYQSFEAEKIPELLPLPKEVTEKVILSRYLTINPSHYTMGHGTASLLAEARRGIPQGSAASSLVAEMLLAPIAHALPDGKCLTMYGDNFLGLSHSKQGAVTILKTLRSALSSHPAGPLLPSIDKPQHAKKGFEFLGYWYYKNNAGVFKAKPTQRNSKEFVERVTAYMEIIGSLEEDKLNEACRYVRSWTRAFGLWEMAGLWEAVAMMELLKAEFPFGWKV